MTIQNGNLVLGNALTSANTNAIISNSISNGLNLGYNTGNYIKDWYKNPIPELASYTFKLTDYNINAYTEDGVLNKYLRGSFLDRSKLSNATTSTIYGKDPGGITYAAYPQLQGFYLEGKNRFIYKNCCPCSPWIPANKDGAGAIIENDIFLASSDPGEAIRIFRAGPTGQFNLHASFSGDESSKIGDFYTKVKASITYYDESNDYTTKNITRYNPFFLIAAGPGGFGADSATGAGGGSGGAVMLLVDINLIDSHSFKIDGGYYTSDVVFSGGIQATVKRGGDASGDTSGMGGIAPIINSPGVETWLSLNGRSGVPNSTSSTTAAVITISNSLWQLSQIKQDSNNKYYMGWANSVTPSAGEGGYSVIPVVKSVPYYSGDAPLAGSPLGRGGGNKVSTLPPTTGGIWF